MKKLILISLILMGCSHQPLSIEERFEKNFYKSIDEGFMKEMIGVQYSFLKNDTFVISNKGIYNWKKEIIQVDDCMFDVNQRSGMFCSEDDLEKVERIESAFREELEKLEITVEELTAYFPGKEVEE